MIRSWDLLNPGSPEVPHPTVVILDHQGVVRYLRQDIDYKTRPSVAELLTSIDSIDDRQAVVPD